VGTRHTQTLTNKSIDASEINGGIPSDVRLAALSGDVSAGTTTTTLATVNSSPGAYGDATHAVQLTVDAKGRITAVSQVGITGGGGASIASGVLASIPSSCSVGTLYFATDQRQVNRSIRATLLTHIHSK
jgi:type V secretory pathway adhesin AidA